MKKVCPANFQAQANQVMKVRGTCRAVPDRWRWVFCVLKNVAAPNFADPKAQHKSRKRLVWDAYNTLLLSDDVERVRKLLVRYDLVKNTIDIPGDIVECGVFKGTGLLTFAKFLAIHCTGSNKKVVGFDFFGNTRDRVIAALPEEDKNRNGRALF
jgi:hypothetical protein